MAFAIASFMAGLMLLTLGLCKSAIEQLGKSRAGKMSPYAANLLKVSKGFFGAKENDPL